MKTTSVLLAALFATSCTSQKPEDAHLPNPTILVQVRGSQVLRASAAQALKAAEANFVLLGGKGVTITAAYRSPEEQYQLMTERCGCPPEAELPSNVEPSDWVDKELCKQTAAECGVASFSLIWRGGGVMRTKPLSHLGGYAVDVLGIEAAAVKRCGGLSPEEKMSSGVPNAPGVAHGEEFCIPRMQQLVIKAMLQHGFCVDLKGNGLREPWHFEHITTAATVGGHTSVFCTADTNDQNMKRLYYLQPH